METVLSPRLEYIKDNWPEIFSNYKNPIWRNIRAVLAVIFCLLALPSIALYITEAYQLFQYGDPLTSNDFIDLAKIMLFSYLFCSFVQKALLKRHTHKLTGSPTFLNDSIHDLITLTRLEGWGLGIGLPLIVTCLLGAGELKRNSQDTSMLMFQCLFWIAVAYTIFQLAVLIYSYLKLK